MKETLHLQADTLILFSCLNECCLEEKVFNYTYYYGNLLSRNGFEYGLCISENEVYCSHFIPAFQLISTLDKISFSLSLLQ